MKQFLLAAALPIALMSCQQKTESHTVVAKSPDTAKVERPAALKIDSLKISDSIKISKTVGAHYSQNVLVFSGLKKQVLDSLYKGELYTEQKPLADYSRESVQKALERNKSEFFAGMKQNDKEYNPDFQQNWDRSSDMKATNNEAGYLTIRYTSDGYTGGAHGYANEIYKVVDIDNQKIVSLGDIVDTQKIAWNKVLLKALGSRSGELFDKKTLTFNNNFYFDKESLTFVYNQYEIAPYASGIIKISVPFSDISGALKPDFRRRLNIN